MQELSILMHRRAVYLIAVSSLAASSTSCRARAPTHPSTTGAPSRPAAGAHHAEPAAEPTATPPAATPADTPPPEPGRLAGITVAHNRPREALGIAPLSWSPELARYAQSWADKLQRQGCRLKHRPRSGPDAQRYGENIFSTTGSAPDAQQVVDNWAAEVADYDAKTGRCRGVCGHYTQVVWRKSERLGCGMAACGDTEVWVCNYDPPGNFMGQRPY